MDGILGKCEMYVRTRGLFLLLIFTTIVITHIPGVVCANPDPCLMVYPDIACTYYYDVTEYYTVGPGHQLYNPMYDRGGEVLLEIGNNSVDESIYQPPNLIGFEPSIDGNDGFYFTGTGFGLIIDGYSNTPTTFVNILVVFDKFIPADCIPNITVNGDPLDGSVYEAGDLEVSTPTPSGRNYSDTMTIEIGWWGQCYGIHIWAFSDGNYNGILDGSECFTAFSHDAMVPVEGSTWGKIKALLK